MQIALADGLHGVDDVLQTVGPPGREGDAVEFEGDLLELRLALAELTILAPTNNTPTPRYGNPGIRQDSRSNLQETR